MEEQNIVNIPWVLIEAKVSGFIIIIIILVIITTASTVIVVVSDEGKEQRSRGISF